MTFEVTRDILEHAEKGQGILLLSVFRVDPQIKGETVTLACGKRKAQRKITELQATEASTLIFFDCCVGFAKDFTTV